MKPLTVALLSTLLAACAAEPEAAAGDPHAALATREFDSAKGRVVVTTLVEGLRNPWSLAFLPDGSMLVTERVGTLRRIGADLAISAPIANVPEVVAEGQGGLLDVALSPDFAKDSTIFLSFAEGDGSLAGTAVAVARLDGNALQDVKVIFRQQPKLATRHHFGSRLVFDRSGDLFVTMGDRGERPRAQDLSNHQGSVARIHADGSVPDDNPFVSREGAMKETWSYGHRNQQGAALNPWTGALWTHEHGPRGGDEINIPQAGRNYGWPIITYGIDYSGQPISEAVGSSKEGLEQPQHYWPVSPGISGMAFYAHDRFKAWQHSLFVGAMAQTALIRLTLDGDRIVDEERLLEPLKWRIRDVRTSPDGAVYVLTDDVDGKLVKVELKD